MDNLILILEMEREGREGEMHAAVREYVRKNMKGWEISGQWERAEEYKTAESEVEVRGFFTGGEEGQMQMSREKKG